MDEGGPIAKAVDLSSIDAPEDDKIKAMMSQSTQDYDPSKWDWFLYTKKLNYLFKYNLYLFCLPNEVPNWVSFNRVLSPYLSE